MNLVCKIALKVTLENLPGTDRERFGVEMSEWKEKEPSIKRGENLTSTTGEPKMEILYSCAPAGVCPGTRCQARAGGDRARRRLRNEALTSGLQPSLSSMAFADFTRKGWRARSNGSFPCSRSWLLEECRGQLKRILSGTHQRLERQATLVLHVTYVFIGKRQPSTATSLGTDDVRSQSRCVQIDWVRDH